jgi:hypothetical protein
MSENLVYLNSPIAVADVSGGKGTIYSRPSIETLAPIYTPQVPIVRAEAPAAILSVPNFGYPSTVAPSSHSPNPLAFVVLTALLVVLIMWLAKIMFRK